MKRVIRVTVEDGNLKLIEANTTKCRCIKTIEYKEPVATILPGMAAMTRYQSNKKSYLESNIYDFTIDDKSDLVNPYMVFVDNNENINESNYFTKEEFYEHFVSVEQWRQNQIDKVNG